MNRRVERQIEAACEGQRLVAEAFMALNAAERRTAG
jgi:hypothetical protein